MAQSMMTDTQILEAALIGLRHQLTQIDTKIADIGRKLRIRKSRQTVSTVEPQPTRKRRRISAAARKRMADATRKRWAEYRANKAKSRGKG
jgi:hypothetical protein